MKRFGHWPRILLIWLIVCAVGLTLIAIYLGPILPPGNGSVEAQGQQFTNLVLTLVTVAIAAFIIIYFGYALIAFRERGGAGADGPPIRGDSRVQTAWIATTTVIVLGLAGFGTWALLGGAGGGQGARPIFVPSPQASPGDPAQPPLTVQVIAQQWQFTFRYPDNGGFESATFVLPVHRQVELYVTSLDVIHSFWVPELGVKADANPGANNIAYVTPTHTGTLRIQCAELCGLFHGYMFDTGYVMTKAGFAAWVAKERSFEAPVTPYLPPFAPTYLPTPAFRG